MRHEVSLQLLCDNELFRLPGYKVTEADSESDLHSVTCSDENDVGVAYCRTSTECADVTGPIVEYIPSEETSSYVISCTDYLADFTSSADATTESGSFDGRRAAAKSQWHSSNIDKCTSGLNCASLDELLCSSVDKKLNKLTSGKYANTLFSTSCGDLHSTSSVARYSTEEFRCRDNVHLFAQLDLRPLASLCASCESLTVFRCGRCAEAYYCNRKCQRKVLNSILSAYCPVSPCIISSTGCTTRCSASRQMQSLCSSSTSRAWSPGDSYYCVDQWLSH